MIRTANPELSAPVVEKYFQEPYRAQKLNHPNANARSSVPVHAIRKNQLIPPQSCAPHYCQFQWRQSSSASVLVNIFKNCNHQRQFLILAPTSCISPSAYWICFRKGPGLPSARGSTWKWICSTSCPAFAPLLRIRL